jgi:hypothetical protein
MPSTTHPADEIPISPEAAALGLQRASAMCATLHMGWPAASALFLLRAGEDQHIVAEGARFG